MMETFTRLLSDNRFKITVLSLLFIAAYWVPLQSIVHTWLNNDDYSYGLMIPPLAAYLLWEKRTAINQAGLRGSWLVLPVLLLCIVISLYGILGSSGNISMPLIPVLIILFVAFCFGLELTKTVVFPLGFLIFMVPVPAVLERTLGMFLKSISTTLGGAIISLLNIPVYVSGNIIDLGVTQLQVVDACNGLRYLFPLIALGVLYAYFFEQAAWKRIVCIIATLPIALLLNAFRIGLTGILASRFGPSVAEGFFHDFTGWVLFMVSFVLLYLLGRMLAFFPPKKERKNKSMIPDAVCAGRPAPNHSGNRIFITAVGLLLIVGTMSWSTHALPPVKLKGGIASFPLVFADWKGRADFIDPTIVALSGAEESFSGQYKNSKDEPLSVYLGYRSTAFLENENFFHSPTVCLPSSGWKQLNTTTRTITGVPFWGTLTVSEMLIESMGTRQMVYFWFQTKNRATHDKNINRFHLALHAIQRDNTHDLFIRPITTLLPQESIENAEKRMDQVVRDLASTLQLFVVKSSI